GEASCPAGDGPGDPAVADEAEGGAVDGAAEELVHVEALPPSGPQHRLGLGGPAAGRQDQEEGEVGGGVVEDAGGVADDDPSGGGRLNVDVVVADGDVGHHPQPALPGSEDAGVEPLGQHGDDAVEPGAEGGGQAGRVERLV